MIKVLVADDSPVARQHLVHILESDPEIRVTGTANDGAEVVEAALLKTPDVITMDIVMPKMDGMEATKKIMETHPVPIVIVSGNWTPKDAEITFRALEAGALALVEKPEGPGHPDFERTSGEFLRTVKLMSEVKVVRHWPGKKKPAQPVREIKKDPRSGKINIVAIGASTGGPLVLQNILSKLPQEFGAPILIVQHIAYGFIQGMIEWLSETSRLRLLIGRKGERPLPGHAYFAPDGYNMGVDKRGLISLVDADAEGSRRQSVSYLFRTVAEVYGRNASGILLTGMGRDGAAELKAMKEMGAMTIIQDRASSVVFGMPGAALELGAAELVLSPEEIAATLSYVVQPVNRIQDNEND
jgi:two-component system, chemotaxis family, protein-glutamate methylesterase/glutaminase